jgi:F-box interacting protein
LWNPATREFSEEFGWLPYGYGNPDLDYFDFMFGYDASTRGYKIVAFRAKEIEGSWKSEVKVFSVGGNCWRNIQSFPVVPINWSDIRYYRQCFTDGVYFSGTVNWLAVDKSIVLLYLAFNRDIQAVSVASGFC